jgi:lambda family phage portal protein
MDLNEKILTELIGAPPQAGAMFGGYEGANRLDQTLALWQPPRLTADESIIPDKINAESRVLDLFRNDAYIASGGELYRDSVVGARFRLNLAPRWKMLGLSEAWAEEFAEEVEERWEIYAESEECFADAARRLTFTGMVRLAVLTYLHHQEVLASVEWLKGRGRTSRTAFLLIDPERLANPMNQSDWIVKDEFIRGGIRRRRNGEPLSYFIHDENPLGALLNGRWGYREVQARKPWGRRQMIYITEPHRIDQTRGISQLVTAIKETKLGRKYRDIVVQNAVVNATYAATLESEMPTEFLMNAMGNSAAVGPTSAIIDYMVGHGEAMKAYMSDSKRLRFDGARIPHLPPGTKLNMQKASAPGGLGQDFEGSVLRYTAAAMGVTYEELTRDLRDTNYSSIKAGINMTDRAMRSRKAMVADRFANQALMCWMEEEINNSRFTTLPVNAPNIYQDNNLLSYANAVWHASGKGQIDELKETQAAGLRLKLRLSTYEKELSRLHGADWRKVFAQIKKENDMMDLLGIAPEESNMLNAASGSVGEADDDTNDNSPDGDSNAKS